MKKVNADCINNQSIGNIVRMSITNMRIRPFATDTRYLTSDHLNGFQKYKYSSIDTNPIGIYIMHPFWDWLIRFFPKWIAPNLITFIGFLFIIKSFLILSYFDYHYTANSNSHPSPSIPSWVFAVVACNVFISYTLDGIDGKQARRTGTSGPMGELFDHGLDSWTTVFIPVFIYSIFGRYEYSLSPVRLYFICWNVFFNFYITHVEKYNTGVLYLPWSYDLSMLGTVIMFIITAVLGHDSWKCKVLNTVTLGQLLEVGFYICTCVFNVPVVIYNLYMAHKTKSGKNLGFWEGFRPMIPFLTFFILSILWLTYSPTNIIERDVRAFCMLAGTIFSNVCCRLIVSQMSNTRCQSFNTLIIVFAMMILVSILVPFLELMVLYFGLLIATVYHINYGSCVVRQMCEHFDLMCFRIRPKT